MDGDCGGPSAPQTLSSHFTRDKGLRDEGFDIGPQSSHELTSHQLVNEFLDERLQTSDNPFHMGCLLDQLDTIEGGIHKHENDWAHEFHRVNGQMGHHHSNPPLHIQNEGMEGMLPWVSEYKMIPAGLHESPQYLQEEDPSDAFRNAAAEFLNMAQQNNDVKLLNTEFGDFMRRVRDGGELDDNMGASTSREGAWSPSQGISQQTSADWASQFNQEMKRNGSEKWQDEFQGSEKDFWDKMASEWEKISTRDNIPWLSEFYDYSTLNKEYTFSTDNPMENMVNALEEGEKRLGRGDLPGAVLCFEAAVKQSPDNPLAWQLLGTTQAENEQDIQAIAALNKCISIEPNNLTALMALAVSYTNESYQNQACKALKEWIRVNPKYSDLLEGRAEQEPDRNVSSLMSKQLYDQVKGLLLEAARRNPQESIDADVQTGLSVIFNLSGEVDLAADCCTAALSVRPNDYRLWNRLGATLANGGRSEEAVDAYRNALQLSPGFIRARYNLGISCVHLKAYREAAEHLLTALNQQVSAVGIEGESNSSMSDTIWTTLRLVISLIERPDLMTYINNRDLRKLNEAFGMN